MKWIRAPALALLSLALFAQDTCVILLGTGTPNPDPERTGPAVAIVSGEHVYIVDCGPGVVRRAAQAGIQMEQLARVFITHLHSDHTAGPEATSRGLPHLRPGTWPSGGEGAAEETGAISCPVHGGNAGRILSEIREHFDGEAIYGADLQVIR